MADVHLFVQPTVPPIGMKWPYEEKRIEHTLPNFRVHLLRGRRHAELLVRTALDEKAKLLVCVGDDTTFSDLVNGLIRAAPNDRENIPALCIHPELQQGDLIRSLATRKTFDEFLRAYLLGSLEPEFIDIGEIEFTGQYGQKIRRLFSNAMGFGFSAWMTTRLTMAEDLNPTKWTLLKLMVRSLPVYRHHAVEVTIDGKPVALSDEALTGIVSNGRYVANGIDLSPSSSVIDGIFEFLFVARALPLRYLLGVFPLFAGNLESLSFVKRFAFQELELKPRRSAQKIRIDFDGEVWGFLPARVRVLPARLKILR